MNIYLLVAEDSSLVHAITALLSEQDVVIVERGVDTAARRLVSMQVDAIVLDDAPGLGLEAVRGLRAAAPHTPVVALSGRSDLVTQAAFTRAGAEGVVVKPFSCESLTDALQHVTAQSTQVVARTQPHPMAVPRGGTLGQHQMALRWISRAGAYASDLNRLSHSLAESLGDIFDTVRTAVLLDQGDCVRVVAGHGLDQAVVDSLRLNYTSGLMRFFDERAALFDRATTYDAPEATKHMALIGARLAAPLFKNGRVFGAVAVGERASGAEYTAEELELLTLIARAASISLGQAHAQAVALEAQGRLASAFEHLRAGVVTVAKDKTITLLNPEAEALLDVHAADVMGRSVQRLGSAFADLALRALLEGQPKLDQELRVAATGKMLHVNASPMNGHGVSLVFSTMEEPTTGENVFDSPFWEYLSSRVAQEVKNPMVAINTFAQLLPRKYDSPDFREAFSRVVQKEVDRINAVVETLFTFARNPRMNVKPGDLNSTVREALKKFEEELAAHSIRLETDLDPMASQVEFDATYLSRAVENLVQNSIEAMPEGGRLAVRTSAVSADAEIVVEDSGPGVPAQEEKHIFLPFYSTKERGMGLGLAIAGRIMQQHQGELRLASGSPGSKFVLKLPRAGKVHADHPDD